MALRGARTGMTPAKGRPGIPASPFWLGQRLSLTEVLPVFDMSNSEPEYHAVTVRLPDFVNPLS